MGDGTQPTNNTRGLLDLVRRERERRAVPGVAVVVLYLTFNKPDFLMDFGTKKWMTVWYGGQYVTQLPLTGTLSALRDLAQCEQSNGRGYRRSDPFDDESRSAPGDRRPADTKGPAERQAAL